MGKQHSIQVSYIFLCLSGWEESSSQERENEVEINVEFSGSSTYAVLEWYARPVFIH